MQASTEMLSSENHDFDWVCPECGSDECEMTAWARREQETANCSGFAFEIADRREVRTLDLLAKWPYSEAK